MLTDINKIAMLNTIKKLKSQTVNGKIFGTEEKFQSIDDLKYVEPETTTNNDARSRFPKISPRSPAVTNVTTIKKLFSPRVAAVPAATDN